MVNSRKQVADKPTVSVVVPVYNAEQFVAAAIESVFAQSYSDWELIVVDDGSKDRSWEIVQQYSQDARVRLLRNDENLGQFPTHNRGADAACGHYIKFLHADDLLYPHCLDVMVALMDAYPDAGMGISSSPSPWCAPKQLNPREVWSQFLLRQSSLMSKGPIRSIFKAETFRAAGGYDPRFLSSDVKMNLTIAMTSPVLVLPEGLTWYRKHKAQISVEDRANDISQKESIVWLRELLSEHDLPFNSVQIDYARAVIERDFFLLCRHFTLKGQLNRATQLWKASSQPFLALFKNHSLPAKNVLENELPAKTSIPDWKAFPGQPAIRQRNIEIEKPLVSVIVAASSSQELLGASLDSILAQRFASWELIIVGENLGAPLHDLLDSKRADLNIRVIEGEKNTNKWAKYNLAAKFAKGKFVKFLDSGDIVYPNALLMMASLMQFNEAGLGISGRCAPYQPGTCLSPVDAWISEFFLPPRFSEGLNSLIVKKAIFEKVGGFDVDKPPVDRYLQLRISAESPTVLINPGLIGYAHDQSTESEAENPFGRGRGYPWLVPWLEGERSPLKGNRAKDALSNLLTAAWHSSRGKLPMKQRLEVVKLGTSRGIPWTRFLGHSWRRHGWSREDESRLQERRSQSPSWGSYNIYSANVTESS